MAAPAAAAKVQPAQQRLPIFTWEGKTRSGEVKKGQMEATDEASVHQRLRSMSLQNVKVRKKSQFSFKLPGIGGISQKDIVIFTRQFATMIDAGLPLVQCLDILARDRKSTRLNSSHSQISYAVFCLKKKKKLETTALVKQ